MDETIRVITLIDMDAFYTQVEKREQHHLRGLPLLSSVTSSRGATITGHRAFTGNNPALAFGVKRGMDCNEPAAPAPRFVCRLARGNEPECGMPFGNKRALATHQGLVHTADEIGATYRCPMPGCLFGTNTERYLNRHVSNVHGGIFTPVLYFAGEALMMTAVQGQLFVNEIFKFNIS
ncbi:hypothetical protein niasHS_000133 [Heterodera schachtii]|uniref:C2H2-type domain-containing protein n=1 Tax=Heterodera schachtii TaxID=97005 RepID=A0ABD2K6T3_HETSC